MLHVEYVDIYLLNLHTDWMDIAPRLISARVAELSMGIRILRQKGRDCLDRNGLTLVVVGMNRSSVHLIGVWRIS